MANPTFNSENSLLLRDEILDCFDPKEYGNLRLKNPVDCMADQMSVFSNEGATLDGDGCLIANDGAYRAGKEWAYGGSTGRIYDGDVADFLENFYSKKKVAEMLENGTVYEAYADLIGKGVKFLANAGHKVKHRTAGYKSSLTYLKKRR